jgi:hypothetical protein
MAEGTVFCREFAFCSDHQVFWRVTNMDTHESPGWEKLPTSWYDLRQIQRLAARMAAKGWEALWNPKYAPGVEEFSRSVSFS